MATDFKKKLTQAELASMFGVSTQTIQNWMNKEKIPRDCSLNDIGTVLRELISNKNNPQASTSKKEQREEIKSEREKLKLAKDMDLVVSQDYITTKIIQIANRYVELTKTLSINIATIISKNAPTETAQIMETQVEDKIKLFTKQTSELFTNG